MDKTEIRYGIGCLFSAASAGVCIYNFQVNGPPLLSALGTSGAVYMALITLREAIIEMPKKIYPNASSDKQNDVERDRLSAQDRPMPPSV